MNINNILSLYLLPTNQHVSYQHRKRLIVHHKLHRSETLPYFCLLSLSHEKNDLIKNYVCKMFLLGLTSFPTVPSLEETLYWSAKHLNDLHGDATHQFRKA